MVEGNPRSPEAEVASTYSTVEATIERHTILMTSTFGRGTNTLRQEITATAEDRRQHPTMQNQDTTLIHGRVKEAWKEFAGITDDLENN